MAPAELDGRAQHLPVEYSGPGETFVRHIANATYGGQVALTEPAWTTVQDHIPGQAQVRRQLPTTQTLLHSTPSQAVRIAVGAAAGLPAGLQGVHQMQAICIGCM